jgi:phage gpG-like protein
VTVEVEILPVTGDSLEVVLDGWAKRAATIQKAFVALVTDFYELEARRFAAEGPGWLPLAASTQQDRMYAGYGPQHPIMVRTDTLALSLTKPGQEGSVYREEPDGFFVGTNVPYAHWHQTGGTIAGRPPRRQLVNLNAADRVRWYAMLGRYLAYGEGGEITAMVTSNAGPGGHLSGPGDM